LNWTEEAFWACSWGGFLDAWTGHRDFVLGLAPAEPPVSRAEAAALDRDLSDWRCTGMWTQGDHDG
jgi:hypothetical protein